VWGRTPDELFTQTEVTVSEVQPWRKVGTYKVGHVIKTGPLFTAVPDDGTGFTPVTPDVLP
jgi:hypothetical protein